MQHLGLDSCIITEKIVKLSCTVKSLYFTIPKQCYLVPGYQVTIKRQLNLMPLAFSHGTKSTMQLK